MKTTISMAAMAIFLIVSPMMSWGQNDESDDNAQPDMSKLINDLAEAAENLTKGMSEVRKAITDAGDSRAEGAKVFDQALVSLEELHRQLAEDSDIWTELTRTQETWEENREFALDKSETNPSFEQIAEEWSFKLEEAAKLRKQILSQRAESEAQLAQIETIKEVALAWYDLGLAERALEQLNRVSSDMARMNESMREIVAQAGQVAGPSIGQ